MSESQDFCLRWSSYSQQLSEALRGLLDRELLVDVTLACDGRSLRAHRAILSACSTYFQKLFQESSHPHPIVILKDVRYEELEALVRFMYHGEVTVNNDVLPGFLHTAEMLHVRGLTDSAFTSNTTSVNSTKMSDSDRRAVENESPSNREEDLTSLHRLSPVHSKRIKLEQPSSSHYPHHPLRLHHHQDLEESINGGGADGSISEQEPHCSLRSEDLPQGAQDQFTVPRTVNSLDGLSQLVMPVIQDDPLHASQYVGASSNLQNQHQLSQQQQALQHHQIAQHNSGTSTTPSGASRPFRQRVLYNQEQLLQLEAWYRQDRYPSGAHMREYADTLAAMVPNTPGSIGAQPMRQNVDYWFQNRRRKDFHPEVMQQREKKKLAKTLWGNYNGNVMSPSNASSGENSNNAHPESNSAGTSR